MSCASHCCKRHGCKYAYKNCPVMAGTEEQEFPCESCDYETEHKFEYFTDEELDVLHALAVWHQNSGNRASPRVEEGVAKLRALVDKTRKDKR